MSLTAMPGISPLRTSGGITEKEPRNIFFRSISNCFIKASDTPPPLSIPAFAFGSVDTIAYGLPSEALLLTSQSPPKNVRIGKAVDLLFSNIIVTDHS